MFFRPKLQDSSGSILYVRSPTPRDVIAPSIIGDTVLDTAGVLAILN